MERRLGVVTLIARMKSFGMNVIEPGTTAVQALSKENNREMLFSGTDRGYRNVKLKHQDLSHLLNFSSAQKTLVQT
jgi:hypothetical protein